MPAAAGVAEQGDRIPPKQPAAVSDSAASEAYAKDAIIAWFRGEFAAANAIIDALCGHLTQLEDGATAYESAFSAIHRRRLNWIPILQMQKYYSIADVAVELKKAAEEKQRREANLEGSAVVINEEDLTSDVTETESHEVQPFPERVDLCSNHDQCQTRRAQIKMTKGFAAKEPVEGHMVNVVRGLKLYENIFTDVELSKLNDFVNKLRAAGRNGELPGETFILYNQQTKGNKRELIQLGVPIFGQIKEDETNNLQKSYIEPIPALLQGVVEHLIQWRLLPENRRPNSCIINFFDEGEYSQPFQKPPHLDQPLSTLLLSESKMVFGHTLLSDGEGNYRGPLKLSLNKGSLLIMRGNSSATARHVMCSSLHKRVSITFFRVQTELENNHPSEIITPLSKAITSWQQPDAAPAPAPYANMPNNCRSMNMMSRYGLLRAPVMMLTPAHLMVMSQRRVAEGGTGVFLPWAVGSRKHTKHLPPRAERRRFLSLPSPVDTHNSEKVSDSRVSK